MFKNISKRWEKKEEAGLIHSSGGVPDVFGLRSVYPVITYD